MCVWITLREMGNGDDSTPRATREFDSARLAALTKQPIEDNATPAHVEEVTSSPIDASSITLARATTLDDPMTTGLLAEVARRSQTTEFDEDAISEVLSTIDAGETTHPHTRRRSSK
jgi:hypothetical protein